MKRCPRCGQGYTDSSINFCLNDGELLAHYPDDEPRTLFADEPPTRFADDSPPTAVMDRSRITSPTNWPQSSPPAPWQSPMPVQQNPIFGGAGYIGQRDQTLPTVALVLGIASVLFVCCYGGIWLGIPAAVVGFIGMRNADSDPVRYGGRGMALGGMVVGIVMFLASLVFLFIGLVAS